MENPEGKPVSLETFLLKHGMIGAEGKNHKNLCWFLLGAFLTAITKPLWMPAIMGWMS